MTIRRRRGNSMTHRHWTEDPEQLKLLARRLCGNGLWRRPFLKAVAAASVAAAGAAGIKAAQAAAATGAAPAPVAARPKTQRAQVFRSGFFNEDPASHDFN